MIKQTIMEHIARNSMVVVPEHNFSEAHPRSSRKNSRRS